MISSVDFSHNSGMYDVVKEGNISDDVEGNIDIRFDDVYHAKSYG